MPPRVAGISRMPGRIRPEWVADFVGIRNPKYTIDGTQRRLAVFKNPADVEHYFDGLRKAGLPEK